MNNSAKRSLIFLFIAFVPASCFAAGVSDSSFLSVARVISLANVALEITSAVSIKQYFFLGDKNRTNFHIFNLIFGLVFYAIALTFLVGEKSFYVGMEQLSTAGCIKKFFFGDGIYSLLQWLVITGMVFNVIYIRKYHDA